MSRKITLGEIVDYLETVAPLSLQENYDNSGLQTGIVSDTIDAALVTLDVTEEVVDEAIGKGCKLIIAHHPVIFSGLKKITGSNSVERIILKAIQNSIAIYAAHTNLDSVSMGVNTMIARKLNLKKQKVLRPAPSMLKKLVTFIPSAQLIEVRNAIFDAGAGHIGEYDRCSFNIEGNGTYRGSEAANPFAGEKGVFHTEPEIRFETIFPSWLEKKIVNALLTAHPYEEVAYDIYPLENLYFKAGTGIIGELEQPTEELSFLNELKTIFKVPVVRHSTLTGKKITRVAVCGGAGSFLIKDAISSGADIFITGDIKYHQFFEPGEKMVIADVGHYESEQFTKELFIELLIKNFPTFAVHLSEVNTNPVHYHI